MRYFLIRDQQSYGPYDVSQLDNYLKAGNVVPTDRLESEDRTVQTTVSELLTFRTVPSAVAPPVSTPSVDPSAPNAGLPPFNAAPTHGSGVPNYPPIGYGGASPAGPQYGVPRPNIPNYLVMSILVTLFCCLPSGIVAIVYASQVNTKAAVGDIQGAMYASKQAKTWSFVGLGVGLFGMVLYFGLVILGTAARL